MTDGQLYLDPQQTLNGAGNLTAAGKDFEAQRQGAGAEIAGASARPPWGSDDIGSAFEKGYRPMEQKVLLAWEKLAGYVEGLGYAAARSVHENMNTDTGAGARVRQTWRNT